jgi:hypothetical protein
MKAWLLALIVLVLSCAVGAYYVGGSWTGLEGFDSARKIAQKKCESDYQNCIGVRRADMKGCTTIYNKCNATAQGLDKSVSTVPNAPSSGTQRSAQGAIAYTKTRDASMLGKGDAVEWAKSGDMLKTQTFGSANPDPIVSALRAKMAKGYVPTKQDLDAIQNTGYFDDLEEQGDELRKKLHAYYTSKKTIKPHETPKTTPPPVKPTTHNTRGDDEEDEEGDSLRSQIRKDIQKAVEEQVDEIENEYEISYE